MAEEGVLLGVDVGTTYCKAGSFEREGSLVSHASAATPTRRNADGHPYYDAVELFEVVASVIRRAEAGTRGREIAVVGVAGMAEAGLLVDRDTGAPVSDVLPWFDTRPAAQAESLARSSSPEDLFRRSGLPPSYKYGLPKLMWLRDQGARLDGVVWLSAADWIVYCLTGRMVTDPTLAARTYAYGIAEHGWDEAWIRKIGFDPEIFPEVLPSGAPAGTVTLTGGHSTALMPGTPVSVAGHDHVCALLAADVTRPGRVLDSMGTAESLLGVLAHLELGQKQLESGLAIVPHVLSGRYCWLGGLPASGGSIEWLRAQLGEEPLSYEAMDSLLRQAPPGPTGILYFPYLSGSGAPRPDGAARAAFVGISATHGRADLAKAVLEGVAYEVESTRQAAERMTGGPLGNTVAVGGGSQNAHLVQIKADVSGHPCIVPRLPEATVLGAALTAALGTGVLAGVEEVETIGARQCADGVTVVPDPARHRVYRQIYEKGYLSFQDPLRHHFRYQLMLDREAYSHA